MRCGQGRLLLQQPPSPPPPSFLASYEETMFNVEVVESCAFAVEYTNISHWGSDAEVNTCAVKRFVSRLQLAS
jgi:hypothetical protein